MVQELILTSLSETPDIFEGLRTNFNNLHSIKEIKTLDDIMALRAITDLGEQVAKQTGVQLRFNLVETHLKLIPEFNPNCDEEDFFV